MDILSEIEDNYIHKRIDAMLKRISPVQYRTYIHTTAIFSV
ncbi:hypothetical protein ACS2CR_21980 [Bacillus cereus group sp. BceL291]